LGACPIGKVCRSSNELAQGGKAVFVEDRSEVLRIGIGNDLPFVAHGRQKPLDELGHARNFRTRQLDNAVFRLRSRDLGQSGGHIVRRDRLELGTASRAAPCRGSRQLR
jgi:hypothetical protein